MSWDIAIETYLRWLAASNAPPGTIRLRSNHLTRLRAAFPDARPGELGPDDLAGWMAAHPQWSAETLKSARTTLRSFYLWAVTTGRLERSPAASLPAVRIPRGEPRPCPDAVLHAAIESASPRDRLMLMFAAYAGLRCAEITRVRGADIDDGQLRVTGKGGRVRLIPVHPVLADSLAQPPRGWMFPGRDDGHLSAGWASFHLSALLGEGQWTAHTLRHRFACQAYAATNDLRAVQELLGHSKPETTARYTLAPLGALRAAVLAVGEA